MYVYVYVYTYIRIYVYTYIRIYVYTLTNAGTMKDNEYLLVSKVSACFPMGSTISSNSSNYWNVTYTDFLVHSLLS